MTHKVMNAAIQATAFKMVDDRGQGFCPDVKIGQTIEGNFSPGHIYKIFNDLLGNDRSLSDSPATYKYFMRAIGKLDGHRELFKKGQA